MTEVDFYVLPSADPAARAAFACRLAAKAWRRGLQVYMLTEAADAASLDALLWDFRAESFIPHRRIDDDSLPASPVEIGSEAPPEYHHGLLVNLAARIPDSFSRFDRVAEIVCQEPAILERLREHYRFYQGRGYPLKRHTLENA